jgi:hypothetical protein
MWEGASFSPAACTRRLNVVSKAILFWLVPHLRVAPMRARFKLLLYKTSLCSPPVPRLYVGKVVAKRESKILKGISEW